MIGKMRHRVALQQPVEVTDAGGGRSITWDTVETVWAHVKPLRGNSRIHAMGAAYPVSHTITMRYRADIDGSWRCVYDSRNFNIHAVVNPDERKHWTELLAEEGLPTR